MYKILVFTSILFLIISCESEQENQVIILEEEHEEFIPELDGPSKASGLTVKTLSDIDLGNELANPDGRHLRMRYFELAPGGQVPVHSHIDRPAILYVIEGELAEHRSDTDTVHIIKAGEASPETRGFSHWVENLSDDTAKFISTDNFNAHDGEKLNYYEIVEKYGLSK